MLKFTPMKPVAFARSQLLGVMAVCLVGLATESQAITPAPNVVTVQRTPSDAPALDQKRLFALGMIETGNNDRVVGAAGEVSRYQLMPSVWKNYSQSSDYRNPDVSLQVARLHWDWLAAYFKDKTGRAPDDFDMYVLWNTKYGYYAHKGFSKRMLAPVVKDRAQRFVNLVYRKESGFTQ